jgi:hypothetical protein
MEAGGRKSRLLVVNRINMGQEGTQREPMRADL